MGEPLATVTNLDANKSRWCLICVPGFAYVQAASAGGLFPDRKNERSFGRSECCTEATRAPYGMENHLFIRS